MRELENIKYLLIRLITVGRTPQNPLWSRRSGVRVPSLTLTKWTARARSVQRGSRPSGGAGSVRQQPDHLRRPSSGGLGAVADPPLATALDVVRAGGLTDSEAVRTSLREAAAAQASRSAIRQAVQLLAADKSDRELILSLSLDHLAHRQLGERSRPHQFGCAGGLRRLRWDPATGTVRKRAGRFRATGGVTSGRS